MPSATPVAKDYGNRMTLETPLLRVSRPVAACSRCRNAKVKCDGKLPACTACEKANKASECASTNDEFARGKERSYVATLEARVERLERKLAENRARRKSSVVMQDATPTTLRRPSIEQRRSQKAMRRKEALDIDDLVSDFGYLAVNATARDFYGFTSAMSYAQLILATCTAEPMPTGMIKDLPPRYSAQSLIQQYMSNIFIYLPFFEETSVYASLDAVYDGDHSKATSFQHWMVRMIFAITSIANSEQRGDTHYTDALGHVNAALCYAEDVLHPGSITSIQALLFLVEYAMRDPYHFHTWHLVGAASRAMVDLGMHQDPSKGSVTKQKLDLRRRVFWGVYSLDRLTSLVMIRAFSFSDDSANVIMPFQEKSTSPTSPASLQANLGPQRFDTARDLYRLRQIQSKWYTELFQSGRNPWPDPYPHIWGIYKEMTDWFERMSPSSLPGTRFFFELELLYSYIYILSSNPRCLHPSDYAQRLVFEHAIAYAAKGVTTLEDSTLAKTAPISSLHMFRAYMTGHQFLENLSRSFDNLLHNSPVSPPATSPAPGADIDPLAAAAPAYHLPPIPPRPIDQVLLDQTTRAIQAINDFTTLLSRLGMRFGNIAWRERFQRESEPLLLRLHQRQQHTASPGYQSMSTPWTPEQALGQDFCLWDGSSQFSGSPLMPGPVALAPSVSPPATHYANPSIPSFDNPFLNPSGPAMRRGWTAVGSTAGGQRYPFPPTTNLGDSSGGLGD